MMMNVLYLLRYSPIHGAIESIPTLAYGWSCVYLSLRPRVLFMPKVCGNEISMPMPSAKMFFLILLTYYQSLTSNF